MSLEEREPLISEATRNVEGNDIEAQIENQDLESNTWKRYTAEKLESRPVHWFILSLITIDSLLVIADLAYTLLSSSCSPDPELPLPLEISEYISIAISSIFVIEIPLSLWSLGLEYYDPIHGVPHAPLHDIDAIVIVGTFILEVVLRGRDRELAGLFILLRFWRIVKLVGGVAVGVGEIDEEGAKKVAEAERQVKYKDQEIAQLQAEVRELRGRVDVIENR